MRARWAELIAVGSELLLGGQVETNSVFLAEELASLGVEVRWKTVVGDDKQDIMEALRIAVRRAGIVVMTGGLGATSDDQTRAAVASVTHRPLRRDASALAGVRERLTAWGQTPTPAQLRQALIPTGASLLANPVGAAPGFWLPWKASRVIVLPGVPAEARAMFTTEVVPRVKEWLRAGGPFRIERRLIHTFGLPEADVEARISRLIRPRHRIQLGLLSSPLGVTVSLRTRGRPGVLTTFERVVQAVRQALGDFAYAEGTETMEEVVGRELAARRMTLAIAESCTGGLIGHRLTQVPGSSRYLDRVLVCYSNDAKMELLGVPRKLLVRHGAVSPEVAAVMAKAVRERSRADVGVGVTGIAGPGGGSAEKPVGLVYVGFAADSTGVLVREFRFHGPRDAIKLRASQAALNLVRQWLPLVQGDTSP